MERRVVFFPTKATTIAPNDRTTNLMTTTSALTIKDHQAIVALGKTESALIALVVIAILFLVLSMIAFYLWTRRRYGMHYGSEY